MWRMGALACYILLLFCFCLFVCFAVMSEHKVKVEFILWCRLPVQSREMFTQGDITLVSSTLHATLSFHFPGAQIYSLPHWQSEKISLIWPSMWSSTGNKEVNKLLQSPPLWLTVSGKPQPQTGDLFFCFFKHQTRVKKLLKSHLQIVSNCGGAGGVLSAMQHFVITHAAFLVFFFLFSMWDCYKVTAGAHAVQ